MGRQFFKIDFEMLLYAVEPDHNYIYITITRL